LPNSRVLLVVETYFFTLMIEKPLFAGLADEFLKSISCRIFERLPIKLRPYASSLSETSDGRCDAVCGRDGTGTKGRTRE
jgi:hypothetical protein